MPVHYDILKHEYFGPLIRASAAEARKKGLEEGREVGREEGGRQLVLRMLTRLFGKLPVRFAKRLDAMRAPDLERLAITLLDAATLEEIFN